MEDYNKIIESLSVRFLNAKNIHVVNPFSVQNHYDVENYLFLLHNGEITYGKEKIAVSKGDMLFVPGGKMLSLSFGLEAEKHKINNEEFISNREKYFEPNKEIAEIGKKENSFSYITFESKVYDTINFFASLDIPPFIIDDNPTLARLIKEIVVEDLSNGYGRHRMMHIKTEQVIIEIVRYIIKKGLFIEQLATKSTYFKDPRLIDIFDYIKKYLGGDLSNKVLANVANVSEDYVGQYFKMLTGINPQDYIEYQRMERAVHLLRTSKKSIREIGSEVGYKDTAYFCRRFKMMFGISAGKMRRRDAATA
ncbi:MAG: AraC family transcriptional regulator [Cytophagales bacterium]|nr:MAG: AraC family transcriptional regulator [Cytophagales bacterium]